MHDDRARGRRRREEAVRVDDEQRRQRLGQLAGNRQVATAERRVDEVHADRHDDEREGCCQARGKAAGSGCAARETHGEAVGQHAAKRLIVEEEQAQQHGQQIEPVIAAGQHDPDLEHDDERGGEHARAARQEDQRHGDELDD